MILGIGNDIIAISRIQGSIDRHGHRFLDKVFTIREQTYCLHYRESTRHFAGRFAAKEAVVKALGTGFTQGLHWLDVEVVNNPQGKPQVICSPALNALFNNPQFMVSVSHCHEYATAVAIWI